MNDFNTLFAPINTADISSVGYPEREETRPETPPTPTLSETIQSELDRLNINGDLDGLRPTDGMTDEQFIEHLRSMLTPVKISIKWPGIKRVLSDENKVQAAKAISADMRVADFSTRLYDMSHARWKNVTRIRTRVFNLTSRMSMDYPHEPGIRLIRREFIPQFIEELKQLQDQLHLEASVLNADLPAILEEGRILRGDAFRREDYPTDFREEFAVTCTFRSIEVASELKSLDPQTWMRECERVRESLEQSIQKTESDFLAQMDNCLSHLVERLQPNEDGTSKVFRETTWTNISDLLGVLRNTGFGTKQSVIDLSNQIEKMTGETSVDILRKNAATREKITKQAETFRQLLQNAMVEEMTEDDFRGKVRQIRRRERGQVSE